MKRFFFESIARIGKWLIVGLSEISELLCLGVEKLFEIFVWIVANIVKLLLSAIDKDRVEHAEQALDQSVMSRELEILASISAVKEDALASKYWSNNHSEALNVLGNRLLNECDWDEERIHDYMRRAVESIPGLGYMVGSEDDEDGISLS
jgi:hypothetical protein